MPSITDEHVTGEFTSLSTIASVSFINNPNLVDEHDAVHISFDLYKKLSGNPNAKYDDLKPDFYVLLKFLGAPDYFKKFKIYLVNVINLNGPQNSVSIVNDSNLVKFQNQITIRHCIIQTINKVDIPYIEKLYVEVPFVIYKELKRAESASVSSFFLKSLQEKGGIVCNGDELENINGRVLLCEPTSQGRVDFNTELVFLNPSERIQENIPREIEQSFALISDECSPNQVELTQYLAHSLHLPPADDMSGVMLSIRPLKSPIAIAPQDKLGQGDDLESFIFVTTRTLGNIGFPIFSGDSVALNFKGIKSLVKISTFMDPNSSFETNHLYVSPFLIHNLGLTESSKVTLEAIDEPSRSLSELLPTASSVTISRVASPITMDKTYQHFFFSQLKTTFHQNFKCVRKNDLISVTIDTIRSKTMFDINSVLAQQMGKSLEEYYLDNEAILPIGDPDAAAWFRIVEVTGTEGKDTQFEQYIIDPKKTKLISYGIDFLRLPPNQFSGWYQYCSLPPIFDYNRCILDDPSLFKYASELKKILLTLLNTPLHFNLSTIILLNSLVRGIGKTTLVRNLSVELGLDLIELDCLELVNPGAELKTIGLLKGKIEKLISLQDHNKENESYHIVYLKHIENLCQKSHQNEQGANITASLSLKVVSAMKEYLELHPNLVFIVSCNDIDQVAEELRSAVKFQIDFNVPSESERLRIFEFLIKEHTNYFSGSIMPDDPFDRKIEFEDTLDYASVPFSLRKDVDFNSLALQSAGLTPRDLISIVINAKKLALRRLEKLSSRTGLRLDKLIKIGYGGIVSWIPDDFAKAINEARNKYSDSIGAPRIPNVKWEDIGGLDVIKDEILDTIDMPLKHPELFGNGLKKRSGILFYGPPGTGKTLLAKAIASNFSLNFFSVKGPELLNMYIGESEANVRRVFQKARDAKPCVIFFDELDSVAPKRGNQGDSGGVMDRIVSQLLAELDGMSSGETGGDGVFVVGATNRPDLLDEALLRPGRFDKMLYLGISDTDDKQKKILEALTRKFKLSDDVDLEEIAKKCPFTYTGADFYALCSDAMLNAMTRFAHQVDMKMNGYNARLVEQGKEEVTTRWWFDNKATPEDIEVSVSAQDFIKAQNELIPSVSAEELQHYLRVRQNFEGNKEST